MSNHRQLKFLHRPLTAAAIGVLAVPALGGVAYAAANSMNDNPKPQTVIPASPSRSAANAVSHDVGDDRAVRVSPVTPAPRPSDDNPATHDIGDNQARRGPTTTAPRPSDDNPATHDVADDQGLDNPATHDVGDDHGGLAQAQVASSGGGSDHHQTSRSGSGADTSGRHDGRDDTPPHH